MLRTCLFALSAFGLCNTIAAAQDYYAPAGTGQPYENAAKSPSTSFATVGRPGIPTILGGRVHERLQDKLDGYPCCGYGKVNTDMGVPGLRSHYSFYWGSGCEFFREACRRPDASMTREQPTGLQRLWNEMFGGGGCSSCGR